MKERITLSFARLLRQLLAGEHNRGDFRGSRQMLEKFIEDGVLDFRVVGKQQQKIFCPDGENLQRYLHNKFEIPSLDQYILLLESEDAQRSDAVKASSDSKITNAKVFQGFFVNAFDTIPGQLNGSSFEIIPRDGAYTFIAAFETFFIPEDVTVVVVENYENFREMRRQRYLFEDIRPLFVWRFQNINTIVHWLLSNKSPYLHYGDFDLKGIHIYLAEFKSKLRDDRGKFFIPPDIETLINTNGAKFLYEDQKSILPALLSYGPDESIKKLVSIITRYKKGLSQEILIR
jgi:hypothetical protein